MSSPLSGMRSDRTDPFHRHCRMQVIVVHVSGICQGSFPIPALILFSTKFCGIFIHFFASCIRLPFHSVTADRPSHLLAGTACQKDQIYIYQNLKH